MRRESGILATTERIPAYGGFQLPRNVLEEMARRLNSQMTPMRLFHDARELVRPENVRAWVQQRPDGEYELRVEFDIEEEA